MSGKVIRGQRLETEIERSREESNWKKVIELAEHLKSRNQPGLGTSAPSSYLVYSPSLLIHLVCYPLCYDIRRVRFGAQEGKKPSRGL